MESASRIPILSHATPCVTKNNQRLPMISIRRTQNRRSISKLNYMWYLKSKYPPTTTRPVHGYLSVVPPC